MRRNNCAKELEIVKVKSKIGKLRYNEATSKLLGEIEYPYSIYKYYKTKRDDFFVVVRCKEGFENCKCYGSSCMKSGYDVDSKYDGVRFGNELVDLVHPGIFVIGIEKIPQVFVDMMSLKWVWKEDRKIVVK